MSRPLSSRDWFGKASAGLVMGFLLALGLAGLMRALLGLKEAFFSLPGQFTMWAMSPVWSLVLSFCFMFRSGVRAWVALGAANALLWAIVWLLGGFGA
jgi:hypothetical protein